MKIIKVIHESGFSDNRKSRKNFTINNYDSKHIIKNFIEDEKWLKQLEIILTSVSASEIKFAEENNDNISWSEIILKAMDKLSQSNPISYIFYLGLIAIQYDKFNNYKKEAIAKVLQELVDSLVEDINESSKQVEIISLEQAKEKYLETRNLATGTYTLHPCNSQILTPLEDFHRKLAMEKDNELVALLAQMGAKSISIVEKNISESSGNTNVSANTVEVNSLINVDISRKIGKGKELFVELEGNTVNLDRELLKNSRWFSDDSQLNLIFESRRFDENKLKSYTLRNTYIETFDFDFDLAAKCLVIKADLKAQYQSISEKERLFKIEFGS